MSRAPLLRPSRFTGKTMLKQLELMRRELANLLSQLPQLWRRSARSRRILTPAEARAQRQAAVNPQARPLQRTYGREQTHGVAQQRRGGDGRQAARPAYLAAHGVEKSFGGRMVVRGVTLYVRRGEAVGLLGPNGAGKTTVFYMITGLINADRGRREADLNALLEEFNIARVRKTPTIALSGGERRRVEIARALATRPSYMLLDEPFAGIDPIAVGDIQALVRHLTNRGIGVLITDHNVRETLGLTDRAYIIYSGSVLMEGRPHEIVNDPEVRRVYLGEEFRM